jgi:hypothetical protein
MAATQIAYCDIPYGVAELDPQVAVSRISTRTVRCYVRGCLNQLRPPARSFEGDACPEHGIRCHLSASQGTYSFADVRRNIIVSRDLLASRIIGHPFKFESHRLGYERSEDAVTWNVFRSLFEGRVLATIVAAMVGEQHDEEPQLYLWGISMTDFRPSPLLERARRHFESRLPVKRPLTEPDIALHLPGRYLILIEAKFTSLNTFYVQGPRQDARSLTLDELIDIYRFPDAQFGNSDAARGASRVPQQLWRNTMFADWMAQQDSPRTRAFHVNLVTRPTELHIEAEFRQLLFPNRGECFRRVTWEDICTWIADRPEFATLRTYMQNKTAGLRKAFEVP